MMKYAVIFVCAGKGKRLRKNIDKAFIKISRLPLFYYSYDTFRKLEYISQIVVVARKKYFPFIRRYAKDSRVALVTGGLRRQDSVYKGVISLSESIDYVFIHDGARPFIDIREINRLKKAVVKYKAATLAVKVKDAIKKAKKSFITSTVERDSLWAVQTPQAFERKLLIAAYRKFGNLSVYDDNQLVELLGKRVKIVKGSFLNIKVTYPEDLLLAEAILKIKGKV